MLRLLLYSWCRSRLVVRSGGIICMQRNVSTPTIPSNFRYSNKSLQITGRAGSAADAPRERRRQAGGRERARGEGEEGSAARSVCGVGASERRGGKRSLEGEGVGTERERKRIDTYIGLYAHTIARRDWSRVGRPCQPQPPPDPLQTCSDLPPPPPAPYLDAQTPAQGGER
ncbi:hypothetical protein ABG768_016365 [Culter alburnus]|uniref:Uncharacterized protein n=1 Tax=Culter alburnus TaxID=194366 RepID=A0AAW1Z0F4_CULAL